MQDGKAHSAQPNHMPVMTPPLVPVMTPPPGGWPNANIGGSYLPPAGHSWADPLALDQLKLEMDQIKIHLASSTDENSSLKAELARLKSCTGDVEATLISHEAKLATTPTASNQSE